MNKITFKILIIVSILAFITAPALATKPGEDVNPNGFPSGAHHNLNIHGKKLDFNCDSMVPDEDGYFGGSIFVPITGTDIEIVMQSGKKGLKMHHQLQILKWLILVQVLMVILLLLCFPRMSLDMMFMPECWENQPVTQQLL